jgi:hypothetical protein
MKAFYLFIGNSWVCTKNKNTHSTHKIVNQYKHNKTKHYLKNINPQGDDFRSNLYGVIPKQAGQLPHSHHHIPTPVTGNKSLDRSAVMAATEANQTAHINKLNMF